MALDLMTTPPMSSDPERTFSLTGLLLTANRARLQPDIIGVSMAVGSWDKEVIIDMVGGQLKRPQKGGTGHTRQESDSTPCQDS
jgi:hAT family C-terminal dimerisation region